MKRFCVFLFFAVLLTGTLHAADVRNDLPRVIVLTDAETDDRCSMVHFLLYANDMQVDAIIQTNSCFQRRGWSSEPWLSEQLDAYAKVYPNLKVHDANYPTPDYLRSRVYVGDEDPDHVMLSGGKCKMLLPGAAPIIDPATWADTPGSDRIVSVLLEDDPRRVFIECWGGANTAARAFYKLRTQYPNDYERAVSKAVLYCIWYQDAAGPYIEQEHPLVTILLNHHFSGSWDYGTMTNTTDFVRQYMHNGINPLGECYTQPYISEGDTPAFLHALQNGLRADEDPTYGGWGGCFYKVAGFERVYRDTGFGQLREWVEPAMHDFQARLQWCVTANYAAANHKPVITVPMGLDREVQSGDTVWLEAQVEDPDPVDVEALWLAKGDMWQQKGITKQMVQANPQKYHIPWRSGWVQYPAGSYKDYIDLHMGSEREAKAWFVAPEVHEAKTIHIILEAYDMTVPRLTSYARFIVTVLPKQPVRQRVLVSTDIGGTDPDDNQSMTHLLMYANEFDLEGLVSSPSFGSGSANEILRMIDLYEADLPALQRGLTRTFGTTHGCYPMPQQLRRITKQGRRGSAPWCGYAEPTEGSQWIVSCARQVSDRPLWVLVWGALEDVAQALHDAPDIAPNIRIYWIGGPNKKWGCNAYNYIVEHFPDVWFIENNATYRGFIGSAKDESTYQAAYWRTFMKGAGAMGDDFVNYYQGIVKMGDTPSLLYLMNGDANSPMQDHWGGRFEPVGELYKYVVDGSLEQTDTVPVYSLMEWRIAGPRLSLPHDSACFVLHIDRQDWQGYYLGDGVYAVRYAPKAPATLAYSITSSLPGFPQHEGTFTVGGKWQGAATYSNHSGHLSRRVCAVGKSWFSDVQDYSLPWQGAATVARHREAVLKDWAVRFGWLAAE